MNRFELAVKNNQVCESKFYERGDTRYVMVEGKTWEEAQENAVKLGGNLATIENQEENQWIVDNIYNPGASNLGWGMGYEILSDKGNALWIGLNDLETEGEWNYISGEQSTFTNWGPGEPDGSSNYKSGEQYVIFNMYKNFARDPGSWGDTPNGSVKCGLAEIKIES